MGTRWLSSHPSLVLAVTGVCTASTTVDAQGQIKADAVVFDAGLGANAGDLVSYTWDGKLYSFEVGVNAFNTVNDAIAARAAAGKTDIQVIIPANSVTTDKNAKYDRCCGRNIKHRLPNGRRYQ